MQQRQKILHKLSQNEPIVHGCLAYAIHNLLHLPVSDFMDDKGCGFDVNGHRIYIRRDGNAESVHLHVLTDIIYDLFHKMIENIPGSRNTINTIIDATADYCQRPTCVVKEYIKSYDSEFTFTELFHL